MSVSTRMLRTLLVVGPLIFAFCMRGGTDTGNARVMGVVYNQDGSRAKFAQVAFVPSGHNPGVGQYMQDTVTTNDTGGYQFDSLPAATYNVLASGRGGCVFYDSVEIGLNRVIVPPCTLKTPGGITGKVMLDPGGTPAVALIAFLGTNTIRVTSPSGGFEIDSIAPGRYAMRVVAIGSEAYTTFDTVIDFESGAIVQLKEPIRLRALHPGIPTPSGLSVRYDTLHQSAFLSWNGLHDSTVQGYAVWRKNVDLQLNPEQVNVRLLTDTSFVDSTCAPGYTYEWHVRTVDTNDNQGSNSIGIKAYVAARYYVTTTISLNPSGNVSRLDSTFKPPFDLKPFILIGDSVRAAADYYNPTRPVKKVEWFDGTDQSLLRTAYKSDSAGTDTVMAAWPSEGARSIIFAATDNAGTVWADTVLIEVLSSYYPTIWAGPDTAVPQHASVLLHGTAGPSPSKIIKWEWNIGGAGFFPVSSGDTTIVVSDSPIPAYPCILRATNDHNFTAEDTVIIRVGQ